MQQQQESTLLIHGPKQRDLIPGTGSKLQQEGRLLTCLGLEACEFLVGNCLLELLLIITIIVKRYQFTKKVKQALALKNLQSKIQQRERSREAGRKMRGGEYALEQVRDQIRIWFRMPKVYWDLKEEREVMSHISWGRQFEGGRERVGSTKHK